MKEFLRRIGAPLEFDPPVCALVVHHLAHHHGATEFTDTSVRRLENGKTGRSDLVSYPENILNENSRPPRVG